MYRSNKSWVLAFGAFACSQAPTEVPVHATERPSPPNAVGATRPVATPLLLVASPSPPREKPSEPVTAAGSTHASSEALPTMVFDWGTALMSDGRVVAQYIPDGLQPVAGESALTDGFMRVRNQEHTHLLREGVLSKPIPSYFQPGTVKMVAPFGECLLTHSAEVWCQFWTWAKRFKHFVEDDPSTRWYRLEPRRRARIVAVDGSAVVGCALIEDGRVDCWVGEDYSPVLTFPRPIKQVAVTLTSEDGSGPHICVLDDQGKVGCWGSGTSGQLGYVAPRGHQDEADYHAPWPPKKFLSFPSPAKKIYAFPDISCALLESADLWCWGRVAFKLKNGDPTPKYWTRLYKEDHGKLGGLLPIGTSTMPNSPIELPSDCNVKQLVPLAAQACVLCDSGCVKCWTESPAVGCLELR